MSTDTNTATTPPGTATTTTTPTASASAAHLVAAVVRTRTTMEPQPAAPADAAEAQRVAAAPAAAAAAGDPAAGTGNGAGNGTAGVGHSGVPDAYMGVLRELVDSEAQYCAQLTRIVKDYRKPLLAGSIIDQSTALVVFSNIDSIYKAAKSFLAALNSSVGQGGRGVGSGFCLLARQFKDYQEYAANHSRAVNMLHTLMRNQGFVDFVQQVDAAGVCAVEDLLATPLHRLPMYATAVQQLVLAAAPGTSDIKLLVTVREILEQVTLIVQSSIAGHANHVLAQLLDAYPHLRISGTLHTLVREAELPVALGGHESVFYARPVYLFNDIIVVGQPSQPSEAFVMQLADCDVTQNQQEPNFIRLAVESCVVILDLGSSAAAASWLEHLPATQRPNTRVGLGVDTHAATTNGTAHFLPPITPVERTLERREWVLQQRLVSLEAGAAELQAQAQQSTALLAQVEQLQHTLMDQSDLFQQREHALLQQLEQQLAAFAAEKQQLIAQHEQAMRDMSVRATASADAAQDATHQTHQQRQSFKERTWELDVRKQQLEQREVAVQEAQAAVALERAALDSTDTRLKAWALELEDLAASLEMSRARLDKREEALKKLDVDIRDRQARVDALQAQAESRRAAKETALAQKDAALKEREGKLRAAEATIAANREEIEATRIAMEDRAAKLMAQIAAQKDLEKRLEAKLRQQHETAEAESRVATELALNQLHNREVEMDNTARQFQTREAALVADIERLQSDFAQRSEGQQMTIHDLTAQVVALQEQVTELQRQLLFAHTSELTRVSSVVSTAMKPTLEAASVAAPGDEAGADHTTASLASPDVAQMPSQDANECKALEGMSMADLTMSPESFTASIVPTSASSIRSAPSTPAQPITGSNSGDLSTVERRRLVKHSPKRASVTNGTVLAPTDVAEALGRLFDSMPESSSGQVAVPNLVMHIAHNSDSMKQSDSATLTICRRLMGGAAPLSTLLHQHGVSGVIDRHAWLQHASSILEEAVSVALPPSVTSRPAPADRAFGAVDGLSEQLQKLKHVLPTLDNRLTVLRSQLAADEHMYGSASASPYLGADRLASMDRSPAMAAYDPTSVFRMQSETPTAPLPVPVLNGMADGIEAATPKPTLMAGVLGGGRRQPPRPMPSPFRSPIRTSPGGMHLPTHMETPHSAPLTHRPASYAAAATGLLPPPVLSLQSNY